MEKLDPNELIIAQLKDKSKLKQKVYDNTKQGFDMLKEVAGSLSNTINSTLQGEDTRIQLSFFSDGQFDARLKVAGDMLFFKMHSNVFQFNRDHEIWKTKYFEDNTNAGYSGIISIYNFLADSFKYKRFEDMGYLIARVFINHDNHFFVQGKRQTGFSYATIGNHKLDQENMLQIIQAAINYSMQFDLLVPPYDTVKLATVGQMHQSISDAKLRTGKRLGFQYNSDDIE